MPTTSKTVPMGNRTVEPAVLEAIESMLTELPRTCNKSTVTNALLKKGLEHRGEVLTELKLKAKGT